MKRMAIPSSLVLLFTLMYATPVLAAAPLNDAYSGRTVIGGLPYVASLDTTEATSDADEAVLGAECGAPAADAGVWYELTAPADMTILIDVSASTYTADVAVTTGAPGAFGPLETCGPNMVIFPATGGTTYVVMVFDDQLDGGGNGGTLELSVSEAPPPPEVDVTLDPIGRFDSKTGQFKGGKADATVSGTACTFDCGFDMEEASIQLRR